MSSTHPFGTTSSPRRPALVLATLLIAIAVGEWVLAAAFADVGAGRLPAWLPQFGSVGETVVLYIRLVDVLTYVGVPATLVWLGYAFGRDGATGAAA